MKGNTSRQWPEYFYYDDDSNLTAKPKRFSFGIKFDEELINDDIGNENFITAVENWDDKESVKQRKKFAKDLKKHGINRINVSLDTIIEKKFREITRFGNLQNTLDGCII